MNRQDQFSGDNGKTQLQHEPHQNALKSNDVDAHGPLIRCRCDHSGCAGNTGKYRIHSCLVSVLQEGAHFGNMRFPHSLKSIFMKLKDMLPMPLETFAIVGLLAYVFAGVGNFLGPFRWSPLAVWALLCLLFIGISAKGDGTLVLVAKCFSLLLGLLPGIWWIAHTH
jgi:hypothetical protein